MIMAAEANKVFREAIENGEGIATKHLSVIEDTIRSAAENGEKSCRYEFSQKEIESNGFGKVKHAVAEYLKAYGYRVIEFDNTKKFIAIAW